MSKSMSNAIARKHFLHDNDTYEDERIPCCYFAEREWDESGWGFWVRADGTVDADDVSATGELPSHRIVESCRTAAVKHLKNKVSRNYAY